MKHLQLFENFTTEYHLRKFIDKPEFQYYLSPGPMRVAADHPHEDYSFRIRKDGSGYKFEIPTDEQIAQSKEARKETLAGIKSGKTVWWTPGGYHFGVRFTKNALGNTVVDVVGRPSSAVGKSPLFKQYTFKGWNLIAIEKEAKKYTYEVARKLMLEFNGKPITFV
jgi:hypothetical protein